MGYTAPSPWGNEEEKRPFPIGAFIVFIGLLFITSVGVFVILKQPPIITPEIVAGIVTTKPGVLPNRADIVKDTLWYQAKIKARAHEIAKVTGCNGIALANGYKLACNELLPEGATAKISMVSDNVVNITYTFISVKEIGTTIPIVVPKKNTWIDEEL